MKLLFRKSLRDIRQRWVAFLSCAVMVAVAAMLFVTFLSAYSNLEKSSNYVYERLKFLDFYVPLRSAPGQLSEQIAAVPGVEAVVGRRVVPLRLRLADGTFCAGRAIGVPADGQPAVNQLHLDDGRYLRARQGEVLMEKRFAAAHGYRLGDPVVVERYRVPRRLTLVGLVSSPEYIWVTEGTDDPRPAAHRYGVLFVSHEDAFALDGDDGITELHVRVRDHRQRSQVMEDVRRRLGAYPTEAPVPREEQASNALLLRDRKAFAQLAVMFPAIFLSLSALVLVSTLMQLVAQQRRQIGVLLSQGFSAGQMMVHYLVTSACVGGASAAVGALAGWALGGLCTRYYADSLGIPFVATSPPWAWMLAILLGAMGAFLAGGWLGVRRFVVLDPVDLLRADFSPTQRSVRLLSRAPYLVRLPVRNLFRQPGRSLGVILGIALAAAQMVLTLMFLDSERGTLEFYFQAVHRYTIQANLYVVSPADLPPVERWPGVLEAEGFLAWRVRMGRRVLKVWGVPARSEVLRLYDSLRRPVDLADTAPLLMGPIPMRQVDARPGSYLRVRSTAPGSDEATLSYAVGPELFEPIAVPPKVLLRRLQAQRAARDDVPDDAINMLMLRVAPGAEETVRRQLYACPDVISVQSLAETQADVRDLLKMLNAYLTLMIFCSCLLAAALLGGATALSITERSRELASLSVQGVPDRALAGMLVVETLIAWFLGLALGLPGGVCLGNFMLGHYGGDLIQLSLSVSPGTLAATALGTLAVCLASTAVALGKVLRIPLTMASSEV